MVFYIRAMSCIIQRAEKCLLRQETLVKKEESAVTCKVHRNWKMSLSETRYWILWYKDSSEKYRLSINCIAAAENVLVVKANYL